MTSSSTPISTIEAINQRASVRSYTPERVDQATIRALLLAAVRAPTSMNEDPRAFSIIQDVDALKQLSDRAKPFLIEEIQRAHLERGGHPLSYFASPEFNLFYNANTLIVICGKSAVRFSTAECWLAAENLMLAACSMGLGSSVIGSAVSALNDPEIKSRIGITLEMMAIVPIIVGVPDKPVVPGRRKDPHILYWK
ncbi:nitroreductase family protein [Propionivibrio sp.]|uniref:nitroreductase family protein n=1 Tax=Propionivibrio sp. TaxID=2212460 RepID=UPI003BF12201